MIELSRRDFLKMAGAFGAGLMLPGNSVIATYAEDAAFPWTREEVLFGPKAGFEKARSGDALSVWKDPGLRHVNSNGAIDPWNKLALSLGRGNFFVVAAESVKADIKVEPGLRNMIIPSPNYVDPYISCQIYIVPYGSTDILTHELGHAFGLVDFVRANTNIREHINPARCDNPNKPYRGVMAYCNIYQTGFWFGMDDQMLLRLARLA